MPSKYITKNVMIDRNVEVEVDTSDFETEDLIEELEKRGFSVRGIGARGESAWDKLADAYHFGHDPDRVVRDLIYENTGRIIQ